MQHVSMGAANARRKHGGFINTLNNCRYASGKSLRDLLRRIYDGPQHLALLLAKNTRTEKACLVRSVSLFLSLAATYVK